MANEHLRTAAANLIRAVDDVKDQQRQLKANADDVRRNANTQINKLQQQILREQNARNNQNESTTDKVAHDARIHKLQLDITILQQNSATEANNLERKAEQLEGQVNEFKNLAGHLEMIG